MAFGRARNTKRVKEISSVRRSQLISTYGIGSLIPVESESFIMLGQDEWPHKWLEQQDEEGSHINEISEPTFAAALGVRRFFQPPSGDFWKLPVTRFPEWVTCPKCHRLNRWSYLAHKNAEGELTNYCRHCKSKDASLITSRFVAACSAGHIQDFPYFKWVHKDHSHTGEGNDFDLYLDVDSSDESLKGMSVRCSCGARRTMENSLGRGTLSMRCEGRSPWLPALGRQDCDKSLVGLQRGATRVWQADTRSAISIDRPENPAVKEINSRLDDLQEMPPELRDATFQFLATKLDILVEDLRSVYDAQSSPGDVDLALQHELRAGEYDAFGKNRPELTGAEDFVCKTERVSPHVREATHMDLTATVPRLKEVRALTGFSRIDPVDNEQVRNQHLLAAFRTDWLPAIEAYGEGVFVRLEDTAVSEWEKAKFALERAQLINDASDAKNTGQYVTPRLLLLHSLSHALLNELALKTGYPASSIRERVYADDGQAGILLYTATADSAGSLGGLCAQGSSENLIETLEDAIEAARWCSADPVCIESDVHGVNNRNLAACHYCMLAPEVSCERQNVFLDRACLVGTPEEAGEGFFSNM